MTAAARIREVLVRRRDREHKLLIDGGQLDALLADIIDATREPTPADMERRDILDLDALAALAKAATPGPWGMWEDDGEFVCINAPVGIPVPSMPSGPDAVFIATADPPTVLRLIEALRDMAIVSSSRSHHARRLHDALLEALDIADEWTPSSESDPIAKELDDRIAELRRLVSP